MLYFDCLNASNFWSEKPMGVHLILPPPIGRSRVHTKTLQSKVASLSTHDIRQNAATCDVMLMFSNNTCIRASVIHAAYANGYYIVDQ